MDSPTPHPARDRLAENLARVLETIEEACRRAGRDAGEVRLVAVTKYVDAGVAAELVRLGVRVLGESRPGVLLEKRPRVEAALGESVAHPEWHLLGHLQRNKVRRVLPATDLLHSGDSLRLLELVGREAERSSRSALPVLVQVNVSGEATKGGVAPEDLPQVLERLAATPGIEPRGLMTMAPRSADPETTRPIFAHLRELRDAARARGYLQVGDLSMGMSGDFPVAVAEGATLVRVGSALFERVES